MFATGGVDELGGDTNSISSFLNAPLQYSSNVQLLPYLAHIGILSFE